MEKAVEVDDARYWRTDEGLAVAVRVRNRGDRTRLVSCGIRQIQFDSSRGRLTVWFSDHGRDPGREGDRCRVNTVPRTVEVEPGKEVEVRGRVPTPVRRLLGVGEKGPEFEVHRAEDVREVELHVAVAEAPFYPNPKAGSIVRQLKEWGEDHSALARQLRGQQRKEYGA